MAGEGGTLNCAPSADTVAGNGTPLNWRPSAHAVAGEESFEGRSSGTTICQSLDRAGTTRWHHRGDRRPTPAVSGATTREYESAEGPGEPWRRYPGQNRHYDDHL